MKKGLMTVIAVGGFLGMASIANAQDAAAVYDLRTLAYPLGLGLAALGSGLGLGRAVGSAMEAMGRQPEAIPKIQTGMIIGCAFIEALTIYALISIFLIG
ncbi:ATP synthase F0 subunit C [Candidatus Sumerlaeota bacterium]|nr:ATP synthase F0 subunit C [Candidatus Sumerlaeota bacterium]